jgi:hypothetical protein
MSFAGTLAEIATAAEDIQGLRPAPRSAII